MDKEQYIKTDHNGTRYYSDEAMTVLHREDGPALVWADGTKDWFLNGERHREDGPAIEGNDGLKVWYLNGERVNEDGTSF